MTRWERFKAAFVRFLDFCNVLDDATKKLSPTKLNVWGAQMATYCTVGASIIQGFAGHLGQVEHVWGLVGGWLSHAYTAHHFDKRERNRAAAAMARVATGQSTIPAGVSTVTTVKES